MLIPAMREMALDGLSPRAIRVYALLCHELAPDEFRPVKVRWVARMLRMDRSDARKALRVLVEHGYLDRDGRDSSGVHLYQIRFSRRGGGKLPPGRAL